MTHIYIENQEIKFELFFQSLSLARKQNRAVFGVKMTSDLKSMLSKIRFCDWLLLSCDFKCRVRIWKLHNSIEL